MKAVHHFALLAPVPLEHLPSGKSVAEREGFVAFGTRKWDLFRKLEVIRAGAPVPVLIYQSDEGMQAKSTYGVSWFGWYVGSVESRSGAHPLGMKHRPSTTENYPADNAGYWATFWHVQGLRELPKAKQVPIGKIGRIKDGLRKDTWPRGPELVALPEVLSYED